MSATTPCLCGCGHHPTAGHKYVAGHAQMHVPYLRLADAQRSVNDTGCWIWPGHLLDGYGIAMVDGVRMKAYRWSYKLARGPIPEGLTLDHLCRNRACVNPDHLEPVTHAENVRRGISPAGINAQKTACIYGHPYSPENTYRKPSGSRECRTCRYQREQRRKNQKGAVA